VWLIYGAKTGWIGGQLQKLLEKEGQKVVAGEARLEQREAVEK